MGAGRRTPEIVLRDGKPRAVILDIDEYQELLERAEDVADLKMLRRQRRGKLRFQSLDGFLSRSRRRV